VLGIATSRLDQILWLHAKGLYDFFAKSLRQ
jgi:hypothetical protein